MERGTWRRPALQRPDVATVPRWALLPAVLGALVLAAPVVGMLASVDIAGLPALLTSDRALDALWLSLRTSSASTVLCLLLGVPLALALARLRLFDNVVVRTLVLLPLVLPPVVAGIALVTLLGRQGLLGSHLDALGIRVAFTTVAVVIAQTFVSLPFLVVSLDGALRSVGGRHEGVAATLGASPSVVFRRVTLPLVRPALVSGTVLAFARSLGEFGATLTFAGSLQGTTRTLPLQIYLERESDPDAAVALSVLLVVVAVVVMALARPDVRR
ncbi:ABC transporter permease [Janibacter melonis]|uniref:ABC transporter permease n=1 Tax=Janibacter melonis TaxID=262209 RepID=UPI0020955080|nr:ABC transporter permease [Janibacter melonis]